MFIINQDNLRRWAYLSIPKRCVIFHRTFTNRRIKKGVMLKVMHQARLMKKKVEISNVASRKEERVDEFNYHFILISAYTLLLNIRISSISYSVLKNILGG